MEQILGWADVREWVICMLWAALMPLGKTVTLKAGEASDLDLQDATLEAARLAARVGIADEYEDLRTAQSCHCQ